MAASTLPYLRAAIEGDVTDTWDSTDHRAAEYLGCLYEEVGSDGVRRVYRCLYNDSGTSTTLATGIPVITKDAATDINHVVIAAAAATAKVRVRGFTTAVIPAQHYFWAQVDGPVAGTVASTGTAVTVNTPVCIAKAGTAGRVQTGTIGTDEMIGYARVAAAIGAAVTFDLALTGLL